MWWSKTTPTGDAAELRRKLLKARGKVEWQLAIMRAGPARPQSAWRRQFKAYEAELAQTLREIDEGLANLGPARPERNRDDAGRRRG
ncbi:MAG: hypothetical protein JO111_13565 [Caulobacteraceae bacterium]|nr:hypothetical protein [Caulobacteraceae bacterium]